MMELITLKLNLKGPREEEGMEGQGKQQGHFHQMAPVTPGDEPGDDQEKLTAKKARKELKL